MIFRGGKCMCHTRKQGVRREENSVRGSFCFALLRLMAWRGAWERPWLGHESGVSFGGGESDRD